MAIVTLLAVYLFKITCMKKLIFQIGLAAFCLFGANQAMAQSTFDKWPALKNFHGVMSETFHPMEDGNLEPIKTRSGEMAMKAKELAKSAIPAEFNTPAIQSAVKRLQKGSKSLSKLTKKGSDEEIKTSLTALHDVFHEIVGLCRGEKH